MFKLFKKKEKPIVRLWDFSYANKFLNHYRNDIELFELMMFNDRDVKEVFIENGYIVKAIDLYQMGSGRIDGTIGSAIDYPCMHIIYRGGHEEYIACYYFYCDGVAAKASHGHSKLP